MIGSVFVILDAKTDIVFGLLNEAFTNLTHGQLVTIEALQRRVIKSDSEGDHRWIDRNRWDDVRVACTIEGVTDSAIQDSGDRNDVSSVSFLKVNINHSKSLLDSHNFSLGLYFTVLVDGTDLVSHSDRSLCDSSNEHFAEELVRLSLCDEHLKFAFRVQIWGWNGFDNSVEQVIDVVSLLRIGIQVIDSPAILRSSIHDGVLELFVIGF